MKNKRIAGLMGATALGVGAVVLGKALTLRPV